MTTPDPPAPRPFTVLRHAFFDQFLTSESVASDHQLHQSIVSIFVLFLVPAAFLMILLLPVFQEAVIRARLGRIPATRIDDLLAWIAFTLTTYAMVAAGYFTVLAWDALTFDRRDALVLGGLPLRGRTILGAKLSALTIFLGTGALAISLLNAILFGLVTADQLGAGAFVLHSTAMLVAALGASVFIASAIVAFRAAVALAAGPVAAAACGPPLQFVFIVSTLCLVILSPAVWELPLMTATFTGWMPSAWFVGVFEWLRHSPRALDPAFPFATYLRRAVAGTSIAVLAALCGSIVAFSRQMRATLAPPASPGALGRVLVGRTIIRVALTGRPSARARADFILLSLARNRPLQAPIALHAALGATLVIAAISRHSATLSALVQPRTAVLWIPLVMAYWLTIGMRASFFNPSELSSAWTFRLAAGERAGSQWLALRAALAAFVIPRVMLVAALIGPALGWPFAAWHGLLVCSVALAFVDIAALTVHHMPFTRPYEPGRARLRTRWFWYAAGVYVFAYWPARLELLIVHRPSVLLTPLAALAVGLTVLELIGRLKDRDVPIVTEDEALENDDAIIVLDIASATR